MNKLMEFLQKTVEILIVEDEMVLAIDMESSLEEMGYEISGIESTAQDAIKHVNENKPDIVIMDINLKGYKSGLEAAKEIWQTHKIPIIFLTSYSDDLTVKKSMESEPYAYLIKPCREKDIDIAIKTALHKHNYFFKNKNLMSEQIVIDLAQNYKYDRTKRVLSKGLNSIKLTGNELKFFDILSENPKESVSFEQIISYIYRGESLSDMGKLRTLVYRLRAKLNAEIFENVYEFGYRLKLD